MRRFALVLLASALAMSGAGLHALSKLQLRQFLLQSYAEFEERGEVRFRGNEHELLKYTHAAMAEKFSALLNAYCGREAVAEAGRVAPSEGASRKRRSTGC